MLASSILLMAADTAVNEDYKTHVELGYVTTSGNTDTDTFNLGSSVTKNWGKHAFKFTLDAQYAKSGSTEIKNKYTAELTYN